MKDSAVKTAIPDINGSFWPKDIPGMVKAMKAEGVTEFTVSDDRSRIAEILKVFEQNGTRLQGLTSVKSGYHDFDTGEYAMKPAFLMKIL